MTDTPDSFAGLPEDLQKELRTALESMLSGPSFQPVDLSESVKGAPDHIKNYYDMYAYGLDELARFHTKQLRVNPVEPVVAAQDVLIRTALSGMTIEELAGMLAVAVDRLARQNIGKVPNNTQKEATTETNDSESSQSVDSTDGHVKGA